MQDRFIQDLLNSLTDTASFLQNRPDTEEQSSFLVRTLQNNALNYNLVRQIFDLYEDNDIIRHHIASLRGETRARRLNDLADIIVSDINKNPEMVIGITPVNQPNLRVAAHAA